MAPRKKASEKGDKPNKPKKAGRPPGKHSNPDYIQIGGYVRRETYRRVKIRCFEEDLEISEVLQKLLDNWLNSG